jgi:hypothetical protein
MGFRPAVVSYYTSSRSQSSYGLPSDDLIVVGLSADIARKLADEIEAWMDAGDPELW